jgi:hypothetical protein
MPRSHHNITILATSWQRHWQSINYIFWSLTATLLLTTTLNILWHISDRNCTTLATVGVMNRNGVRHGVSINKDEFEGIYMGATIAEVLFCVKCCAVNCSQI